MNFFVAKDGEKLGPLTQYRMSQMLRDGDITASTKVWHEGLDEWVQADEVTALQGELERIAEEKLAAENAETETSSSESSIPAPTPPPPLPETKEKGDIRSLRPFHRFLARNLDYMIVGTLVILFSSFSMPVIEEPTTVDDMRERWLPEFMELQRSEEMISFVQQILFAMMAWHLVEGVLLHLFGTTPGKFITGISIRRQDGLKPSIMQGIGRSLSAFCLGMGLFFSIISLIAMVLGFIILVTKGRTLWDNQLNLEVHHKSHGLVRIFLAMGAFLALMIVQQYKLS
ncbi:MAG: RDD family protein [Verrucomicrobiota bacterium]